MMWNIKQAILNGSKAVGVNVTELPLTECRQIRETILSKFTESTDHWPRWLWDSFITSTSYPDREGWSWIGDYCSGIETVLLFAEDDEPTMFKFGDGSAIAEVFGECFGFEFYLTNCTVDFVLCFNHHDCIIATGQAIAWLEMERFKRE